MCFASWRRRSFRTKNEVGAPISGGSGLAQTEPGQAAVVAEAIKNTAPGLFALVAVADALTDAQRGRKVALLDREAVQLKALGVTPGTRTTPMADWPIDARAWGKGKGQDALGGRTRRGEPGRDQDRPFARQVCRTAGAGRPAVRPGHRQGVPHRPVPAIPSVGSSGTSPSTWPRTIPPRPNEF